MSAINLFQLLPAVYRMRDAQIASAQTLLTPAQQSHVRLAQACLQREFGPVAQVRR